MVDRDLDELSVWAARYALGRMTYAAHNVVELLERRRGDLRAETKAVICRDIDEAAARGGLGMDIDADAWRRLRKVLTS